MKKSIIVLMVLALTFTGCAGNNQGNNVELQKQSESPATDNSNKEKEPTVTKQPDVKATNDTATKEPSVKTPKKKSTLVQLTTDNQNVGCSTENGYYYITKKWGEAPIFNLNYFDYKTKQDSCLCQETNCDHSTDQCQGCITEEIGDGGAVLFTDDKKVYLLVNCIQKEGAVIGREEAGSNVNPQGVVAALYSMEMDGSNRTKVCEFEPGETVNNRVFCDGKRLIMLVEKLAPLSLEDNKVYMKAESKQLIEVSLDNNKRKDIMEIEPDLRVVGCASEYLILAKEEFDSQYPLESIVNNRLKMKEAMTTEVISFFKLDINSKQQDSIIQLSENGAKSYAVFNDTFYYGIEKTGKIMQVDVTDGKAIEVGDAPNERIAEHYQSIIILKTFAPYSNKSGTIMSLDSGNTQDITLDINGSSDISILGYNSTHYLVQSGSTEQGTSSYALISISDFHEQKDQYEEVKLQTNGSIVNFVTYDKYVG